MFVISCLWPVCVLVSDLTVFRFVCRLKILEVSCRLSSFNSLILCCASSMMRFDITFHWLWFFVTWLYYTFSLCTHGMCYYKLRFWFNSDGISPFNFAREAVSLTNISFSVMKSLLLRLPKFVDLSILNFTSLFLYFMPNALIWWNFFFTLT